LLLDKQTEFGINEKMERPCSAHSDREFRPYYIAVESPYYKSIAQF